MAPVIFWPADLEFKGSVGMMFKVWENRDEEPENYNFVFLPQMLIEFYWMVDGNDDFSFNAASQALKREFCMNGDSIEKFQGDIFQAINCACGQEPDNGDMQHQSLGWIEVNNARKDIPCVYY